MILKARNTTITLHHTSVTDSILKWEKWLWMETSVIFILKKKIKVKKNLKSSLVKKNWGKGIKLSVNIYLIFFKFFALAVHMLFTDRNCHFHFEEKN